MLMLISVSLVGRRVNVADHDALAEQMHLADVVATNNSSAPRRLSPSARWSVVSSSTPSSTSTDAGTVLLNM